MYKRLLGVYNEVRRVTDYQPRIALILGSGLGDFAEEVTVHSIVNYGDIKGFPVSTVSGHRGRFLFGAVAGVPAVVMQGRVHYYEGYPMEDVVLPTRLMNMLGAEALIVTNAAGGVNERFHAGTLMAITDHILLAPNPLIGPNVEELGIRFPDMVNAYDPEFIKILKASAEAAGVELEQGVYCQLTGPSFETPAEVRMVRAMGADAVGMSTACEVVAARHMGMRVAGVSCITNMGAGITGEKLSHTEVNETADRVRGDFVRLLENAVAGIGKAL